MLGKKLALVLFAASAAAGTLGHGSTASASAPCSGTGILVAGQHVTVIPNNGVTYPAACARITVNQPVTGANYTTCGYSTSQRDTATDNQYAVTLVRLGWYDGTATDWRLARQPTGTEAWSQQPEAGSYLTTRWPKNIQFAACRSTSPTGFPHSACGFVTVPIAQSPYD